MKHPVHREPKSREICHEIQKHGQKRALTAVGISESFLPKKPTKKGIPSDGNWMFRPGSDDIDDHYLPGFVEWQVSADRQDLPCSNI